jgi:hypothetical protein
MLKPWPLQEVANRLRQIQPVAAKGAGIAARQQGGPFRQAGHA